MPAVSGTLLPWKPTGPVRDVGWVTAPGEGSYRRDTLTTAKASPWQGPGHPTKDRKATLSKTTGPPQQGPQHPAAGGHLSAAGGSAGLREAPNEPLSPSPAAQPVPPALVPWHLHSWTERKLPMPWPVPWP